jgi:zinc/manganese transport system substrate-binding protein
VNRTPEAFSNAVENEQDVPVRVLQQTKDLFSEASSGASSGSSSGGRVRVLVYNAQTTGSQTNDVVRAAEAAGVPVVPVTETLPAGLEYLQWMAKNVTALEAALASGER